MSELKVCSVTSPASADVEECIRGLEELIETVKENNVTSFAIALTTSDRRTLSSYSLGCTGDVFSVLGAIEFLKTRFVEENIE